MFNGPTIFEGPCSSVSTTPDGKTVWVAQRPNDADPGTIIEIDADTGRRRSFASGINTQAPLPFTTTTGEGLAAICEGTYGRADGSLEIWTNLQGTPKRKTLYVGDTPNHLLIHRGRAYVTVNLSHRVLVIDLATQKPVDTLYVGTSGYDGPRECIIDTASPDGKERLYVTTHTGDVRIFDLSTGERIGSLDVDAKSEGLAIIGRELWVTRTFVKGSYEVTSDIAVFNLDGPSSVQTDVHRTSPAAILALGDMIHIPFVMEDDATLTDVAGKTTPVSAVVSDAQTLDCRHLPSGVYALRSGQHSVTIIR
ncbi:MAG: YncE family protein [Candidatus Kapaibacterium sp.]